MLYIRTEAEVESDDQFYEKMFHRQSKPSAVTDPKRIKITIEGHTHFEHDAQ